MGAVFSFSLAAGIILMLLYVVYKFTMAGEKQFAFNRAIIFSIYILALGLPIAYPALKQINFSAPQEADVIIDIPQAYAIVDDVPIVGYTPHWINILLWIYIAGIFISSIRLIAGLVKIFAIARRSDSRRLDDGYILVLTDRRTFSPFSFWHYIFISREDYARSKEEILIHEMAHLRYNHWIDQMLGNLVAIFLWYNPAAWLMIEELRSVHEYQADDAVISSGADMRQYQYLLIEKAVGKRFPSPANSLNHSKLKKRVAMMYKSKPSMMRRLAGIAVIPAAVAAIAITNIPAVAEVISETNHASLRSVSDGKVSNFSSDEQVANMLPASESLQNATPTTLDSERQSAESAPAVSLLPQQNAPSAEAVASSSSDESLIAEASAPIKADDVVASRDENRQIYTAVEKSAEYPSGMNELMNFIMRSVRYPEEAQKKNIQGRVIVKFVVAKDGKIMDPVVIRGVDDLLDQEALRVVKAMPAWTPGEVSGKPVDSYFVLPVNFRLQSQPDKSDDTSGADNH